MNFHNLQQAANLHTHCYSCNYRLTSLDWDRHEYGSPEIKFNLTEGIDSDVDEWVGVNVVTNDVSFALQRRYNCANDYIMGTDGSLSFNSFSSQSQLSYHYGNGLLYRALSFDCQKCYQFGYCIQFAIDKRMQQLSLITLNSETVRWTDEKKTLHTVRNIYTTQETEYFQTPSSSNLRANNHSGTSLIKVPFMPLNVKQPSETVGRIRKLLAFL